MAVKVGINGFGRIGRNVVRAALNNPADRIRGGQRSYRHQDAGSPAEVRLRARPAARRQSRLKATRISVDGKKIKVFAIKDPAELDWSSLGAQIVIESTGKFTDADGCRPSTCAAR